jgi:ABC-type multidrug transport system fused ATPase/permease subunit
LSTIKDADKIAVVYDGRIVEEGRFDELVQIEDGHFRRMAVRQEMEKIPDEDASKIILPIT